MAAAVLPEAVAVNGLQVRAWRLTDVPALNEAISGSLDHLRPFMPWVAQEPLGAAARTEMVRGWEAERLAGGDAVYAILRDGVVIGGAGAHHRVAPDGLEIGYWLRAGEEGRGTMTRVVARLTARLLAVPGITHVEIRMDAANVRSAAVPPRCGYRLIGGGLREPEAPAETGRFLVWRIGADPADASGPKDASGH